MGIRISLTGRIAIRGERTAVDESYLEGYQPKVAFALLVTEHHHAVSKDTMADVLWAGYPPPSWEASLRRIVSKVRSFIAEAKLDDPITITATSGCYRLDLPVGAVVDIEYAAQLLDKAIEDVQLGNVDKAFEQGARARSLFKRPFLAGIDLPWVDDRRREQKAMLVKTLETMVEARLSSAHPEQAIPLAEEAIGLEPFRESIYRQLMSAYLLSGNRVEGLRTHERLRKLFIEELGANPSPETEELYLKLLADAPVRTPIKTSPASTRTNEGIDTYEQSTPSDDGPTSRQTSGDKWRCTHLPNYMVDLANTLMVGRTAEMDVLVRSWRETTTGSSTGVVLSGSGGTGKTFILAHLARYAINDGGLVLLGRCHSRWSQPYAPFLEMLNDRTATAPLETPSHEMSQPPTLLTTITNRREPSWRKLSSEQRFQPMKPDGDLVSSPKSLSASFLDIFDAMTTMGKRTKLFEEVLSWLASFSVKHPLLVLIEDIHLADPSSLTLLYHLLGNRKLASTSIVVTYDPKQLAGYEELSVFLDKGTNNKADKDIVQLELGGLTEEEVPFLVSPYLPRDSVQTTSEQTESSSSPAIEHSRVKRLCEAVHKLTKGNPLFIRLLMESLQLNEDPQTTTSMEKLTSYLERSGGQPSMEDLIEQKLEKIGNDSIQVLTIASILGDEFDIGLLIEVVEALKPDERSEELVLEAIDNAHLGRLLGDIADDQDRAVFAHSRIQSVIYERLSAARKLRIHRQICTVLENRRDWPDGEPLSMNTLFKLTEHAVRAAPLGDVNKAVLYSKEAGDISYTLSAFEDAIQHYELALQLMTGCTPQTSGLYPWGGSQLLNRERLECETLLAMGKSLQNIGKQRSRDILLRAARLARQLRDPQLLARAALAMSSDDLPSLDTRRSDEEVIGILQEAEELLPSGSSAIRAKLLAALATELLGNSQLDKRLAIANRAIGIARLHSNSLSGKHVLAEVLVKCHQALLGPDTLSQRSKHAVELISLGTELADKEVLLRGQLFHFDSLMEEGRALEALKLLERSDTIARELGRHFSWEFAIRRAGVAILRGEMELAESLANQALLMGQDDEIDDHARLAVYGAQLLSIRAEQGRLVELGSLLDHLSNKEPEMPEWPLIQAYAWLQAGMPRKASRYLRNTMDHIEDFPRQVAWLADMVLLARVCSAVGSAEQATIIAEKLEPFSGRLAWGIAVSSGPVDYALGLLAAVRKDLPLAESYMRKSMEVSSRIRAIPYLIRSEVRLAHLMYAKAQGQTMKEAEALANQASATAADIGLNYLSIAKIP